MRLDEINEDVQPALEDILSKAPYHCELLIQVAMMLAIENKAGRSPKKVTAKNIITIIEFSQNISQALWKDDDNFLQLPYVDEQKSR